jgi:hypothetical protein
MFQIQEPSDSTNEQVKSLLGYMATYFPFKPNGADIKVCERTIYMACLCH